MSRPRLDRSVEATVPFDPAVRRRHNNAAGRIQPVGEVRRSRLKRERHPVAIGPGVQRPRISNAALAGPSSARFSAPQDPQRPAGMASPLRRGEGDAASIIRIEAPSRFRVVVSFAQQAWPDCERELIALARDADDSDMAVVVCRVGQSARDAGVAGADRLVQVPVGEPLRERAEILAACRQIKPDRILLPHGKRGVELARFLAAALGIRPALGVVHIRGGHAFVPTADGRGEYRRPLAPIMSVRDTACGAVAREAGREALPMALPGAADPPQALTDHGLERSDVSMLPLDEAEFIVSAGDGVTDFAIFERTAREFSATIAGSRVVCDAGLLPRDRQIGASGHVARADCYVALGISGAPQHLEGITNCNHVVAVNTDLHAAMVARADLAIIADAQEVMPALLRARGAVHG